MWKTVKPYIISVLAALAVGGLSALLTKGNMGFLETINKPPLSPPSFLFPIVWTVLFILMGISSAYVYKNKKRNPDAASTGLTVYIFSLAVNFFWSIIFFNLRAFMFSFIWLVLLWVLIIITIREYAKVSRGAAYLQVPYLLWVTFAGYLNFMIYIMNQS